MKCPICGQELTQSKKDPNYMLCYNCKKKFRVSQNSGDAGQTQSGRPAAASRSAQARTSQARQTTRRSRREYDDSYDDRYDENGGYEEEHLSRTPIVVLGVAIVIVLGLIIYMLVL